MTTTPTQLKESCMERNTRPLKADKETKAAAFNNPSLDFLTDIQTRQGPWVEHNFPGRPAWQPLLGVAEEVGELLSARTSAERIDAVADITIFLCDYCAARGWKIGEVAGKLPSVSLEFPNPERRLSVLLGELCHAHLKQAQNIRTNRDHEGKAITVIGLMIWELVAMCQDKKYFSRPRDFETEVTRVWCEVEKRDWRAKK